jgi:hypothetical protein
MASSCRDVFIGITRAQRNICPRRVPTLAGIAASVGDSIPSEDTDDSTVRPFPSSSTWCPQNTVDATLRDHCRARYSFRIASQGLREIMRVPMLIPGRPLYDSARLRVHI